jgi:hypothetical protein
MGEIMNNFTFFDTTSTTDCSTLNFTADDTWFPYYLESTWIPYHETKYEPKWHVKEGYKNQISKMWNGKK